VAVATRLTPATGSPSPFLGKTNANGHTPAYSTVATVTTRPGRRRTGRSPGARGGVGRLGCGQPGGQVSGDGGQLRVGPRRQRLACPQVEFVLGQPSLHEGGFQGADDLLTVGVGRPEIAVARGC